VPEMSRLRKVLVLVKNMPFMLRGFFRLSEITNAGNWEEVVDFLEEMHTRQLDSDDTHYRLGCAYVMLGKWHEAVREFEQIKKPLPEPKDDTRRYFNYALALTMVGRKDESMGVLEAAGLPRWRPELRGKGEQLLQHLRGGDVPPPGVH